MLQSDATISEMSLPWLLLSFDNHYRLILTKNDLGEVVPSQQGMDSFNPDALSDNASEEIFYLCTCQHNRKEYALYCQIRIEESSDESALSLKELSVAVNQSQEKLDPLMAEAIAVLDLNLHRLPYLDLSENEYIYRFRTSKERNKGIYLNKSSESLYQSALCDAIKLARRTKEKISSDPAVLDFGAVRYTIPSHFGFCLGVQNAIERAYETVANHPQARVFMLSELIHNPFVNIDLLERGLKYLQTDKGLPYKGDGTLAKDVNDPEALWNQLTPKDIVIIPAFGATNEDKARLIRSGISIRQHDATCMLVEKVWKSARRYASKGYTVIIHGKSEHEETKATFSNSSAYGPALVLRGMNHAKALAEVIHATGLEKRERFEQAFAGFYSENFDPDRDLEKIAIVNQTTLLRNETMKIIDFLKEVVVKKYGAENAEKHIWSTGKGDTLCYATQVNQDALNKALEEPVDVALVVGGRNSSNTYQLHRVCENKLGTEAHYIQSEKNILSQNQIEHFNFMGAIQSEGMHRTPKETRPFLEINSTSKPLNILITGGASCPDGIIQQVITRINSFFPEGSLRSVGLVIEEIKGSG